MSRHLAAITLPVGREVTRFLFFGGHNKDTETEPTKKMKLSKRGFSVY